MPPKEDKKTLARKSKKKNKKPPSVISSILTARGMRKVRKSKRRPNAQPPSASPSSQSQVSKSPNSEAKAKVKFQDQPKNSLAVQESSPITKSDIFVGKSYDANADAGKSTLLKSDGFARQSFAAPDARKSMLESDRLVRQSLAAIPDARKSILESNRFVRQSFAANPDARKSVLPESDRFVRQSFAANADARKSTLLESDRFVRQSYDVNADARKSIMPESDRFVMKSYDAARKSILLDRLVMKSFDINADTRKSILESDIVLQKAYDGSENADAGSELEQPSYQPSSGRGKYSVKFYTRLEEAFPTGPGFNTREGCTSFVRNVLALIGFKMLFPVAICALLSFCNEKRLKSCVNFAARIRRISWIIIIPIFVYATLYINLRESFWCGRWRRKWKEANRLVHLLVFGLCEMCIVGVLTVIAPPYLILIVLTTMATTCITISFYCWTASEVEVRGSWMFLIMFPLIFFYDAGITIFLCFCTETPANPIDGNEMLLNFFICLPICWISFGVLSFEIQRLIAGRRIEISLSEWGLGALIVPVSFFYPAFLIRKLKYGLKSTEKVHPESQSQSQVEGSSSTNHGQEQKVEIK